MKSEQSATDAADHDGAQLPVSHHRIPRYRQSAFWIVTVAVLCAPLVAYGAIGALRNTSNDPRQWLPQGFEETDRYDLFQSQFGNDEIAVVSWPGCTLDDPRLPQLSSALVASPFFDRALTGTEIYQQLTAPPLNFSSAGARVRLGGFLVGPDGQSTCMVLSTSLEGQSDRSAAVAEIRRLAKTEVGLDESELRLAGPTVDAAAIDAESRKLLFQLAGFSAALSLLIATYRLKSLAMALMILCVAGYSTGLTLAILYFGGGQMNLLMTMLPPLIYVLSISSAVHLVNYYRDAAANPKIRNVLSTAVQQSRLPCLLAASTTAIGLASLVLSKIGPIRMFGLYSALGVLVGLVLLFTLLPAALKLFPPKVGAPKLPVGQRHRIASTLVGFILRRHGWVLTACLALMLFCGSALPSIRSTVKLQDRFLPESDAIQDYQWLEETIGPMVPLEIVVRFRRDDPRDRVQRMRVVAAVQRQIHSVDEPVSTMSAVNLLPAATSGGGVRQVVARQMINQPSTKTELMDAHFLAETNSEQLWRITVRANAIGDLDYGRFSETLRRVVDPVLEEAEVSGTYTGVIPLIYKAQRQLLTDLFRSFLAAFAVIAVVLVVVLRSLSAALLAMIPNLFPAVAIFGGIEWINIPVQIGSVMTASAALGIAVDDTVHFLTWFRRGSQQGVSRPNALRQAYYHCSGAMAHTTMICAGGLIVFAASSFVPILHFAWLMVTLLLAALIGDLFLLPSILAGPLGRCFESHSAKPVDKPADSPRVLPAKTARRGHPITNLE
ncbi:MMPL family protein [Roseimaritima multifibrata]|uniref:MMPL family protein n=1 Tax=Roseimaritima multifibrata TaxID=1930274 RepID=A0A517MJF0_9BACT|nr:MMPL family transporter [Roseimaritima multifibrata]QDS94970.1 MMPL family protein [Roseimaritima multifibrata]